MTTELPEPKSRKESYLAKAAGMDTTIPEKPESREEQYLEAIAEGSGGGGGSYTAGNGIDITNDTISVDTTVVQEKLTAGDNITITNNTISATGGGGTAIDLTQDLYNWNSSTQTTTNPDSIALWLLDPGCYSLSDISIPAYTDYYNAIQQESLIWVFPAQALTGYIGIMVKNTNSSEIVYRVFDPSAGSPVTVAIFSDMNMTLLSVKSNIIQTDSNAAPTSTDYADRGQVWIYMDTNNVPHLYVSAGTDWSLPTPENTWIELQSGGGGGGITTLSAANFNYDSQGGTNYDTVAIWLLPDGMYEMPADYTAVPVKGCESDTAFNNAITSKTFLFFYKHNNKFFLFVNIDSQAPSIYADRPLVMYKVNPANGFFSVDANWQVAKRSELTQ